MRNFQDTFEIRKQSNISAFSIYITVPFTEYGKRNIFLQKSFSK